MTKDYTKEEAIKLVKYDGLRLKELSVKLQNDKDIVLVAVTQNGNALEYASKEFKHDKHMVLTAITQTGDALASASNELKKDKDVVLAAVTQAYYTLQYASAELNNDPVLKFIADYKRSISDIDWPIVWKALEDKPDYFLNPEPYMKALAEGMDYPYLMLAQYALNKDIVIEPEKLPTIEF